MRRIVETYEQAIESLFGRINYERLQSTLYSKDDFKLDRMRQLLALLGNPQERMPAVHVAGTKGKGSTATMIAGILSAAGYRTGLFTSPHISAFEERMSVGGVLPTQEQLVDLVNAIAEPVAQLDNAPGRMSPTYFEMATAMAWLYFAEQQAELAVLEVGLGGRLDATNVCCSEVAVITSISRDHMHLLGSSLAQIAREKAGIVKPGVPVVSGVTNGEAQAVIAEVACSQGCPLVQLGGDVHYEYEERPAEWAGDEAVCGTVRVRTPARDWGPILLRLRGEHQAQNAALAVAAIEQLQGSYAISEDAVVGGMEAVRWPLRIEVLSRQPTVLVDAAHNWESVAALLRTIEGGFSARRRILLFATTKDKDVSGLLRQLLPRFDTVVLTQYVSNPRTVSVEELARIARALCDVPVHLASDPPAAWKLAERFAMPGDLICVTGSFFIAAEMRELIVDQQRTASLDRVEEQGSSPPAIS